MDSKLLLIFLLSIVTIASSQSLSCNFISTNGIYTCYLTIDNPNGDEGFSGITGLHMDGRTNNDVRQVRFAGISPIIPRIICDSFQFVTALLITEHVGIQRLTENALSSCLRLSQFLIWYNPVTEIHPNFFRNNINLSIVELTHFQVTTIPEELFSTITRLFWITISDTESLSDLPVNLFKNARFLGVLFLFHNQLNIWRPEWTQSMTLLELFSIENNSISVIPRNVLNPRQLWEITVSGNQLQVVDAFMFNNVSSIRLFQINDNPIEAIDFNLIDMAGHLQTMNALRCICVDVSIVNFHLNREFNMGRLEPCFAAFDRQQELSKK